VSTFRQSLRDAVRRLAYRTSVDQLKKRGFEKVNVIGLDRIVALIDEAVHRTLKHRLLATERYAVADATKDEFLRLLKSNEELKQAHSRAEEEANSMRLELQQLRQQLEERLAEARLDLAADFEREDAQIEENIAMAVASLGLNDETAESVTARVREIVMTTVGTQRRTSVEMQGAARDRELAQLQRRINKLNTALEDAEGRLQEMARRKSTDPGIASIYREVQGLSGEDSHAELKKALMADIFRANLQLQKKA
jgi:hypothetical protein